MLAAGGRVVRSHHHPGASNNSRLMVPTEKELKTILYDQTGARVTAHNHRENIDYVALHADRRRPRRARTGEGFNLEDRQRYPSPSLPTHTFASTRKCRALSLPLTASHLSQVEAGELHPCRSSEDDAPVSMFLDSFSASGMVTEDAVQAVEGTPDSEQPASCPEYAPNNKPTTHRAEATASAEAAYELSEPLAQVDVYSILAKAPPAKTRNGRNGAEASVNTSFSKSGKNKRPWGSTHRAEKAGSGGQRLMEAEPTPKIAYLARDPLGNEVTELDAKLREIARRLKQEKAEQKPPRATDIARQSALLTEKKMQQQQPASDESAAAYGNNTSVNNPTLPTTKHDGTTTTARGLDRSGDDGAIRLDRGRKKRGFVSTTNNTMTLPHRAGRRGWMGSSGEGFFSNRQTCRDKPMELNELENGGRVDSQEDRGFEAKIVFGDSASVERDGGKSVPRPEARKRLDSEPRRRKRSGRNERGEHQLQEGESSFQSGRSTRSGAERLAAISAGDNGVGYEEHVSHSEGSGSSGVGDSKGCDCSGGGGAAGVFTEDAAALRIEACWRGFLGRCAAKHELRSVLFGALRKIGGGRVSKAMALGDVGEGDRRELNHALRTATQSRLPLRQLPPQAQILECARFVAVFQRRHAKAVDARKKR
ncbi:unnamed protein product, partial [Laminaria digitata]